MILYFSVCFLFFFLIFFVNQILLMAEDILSKKAPFKDVALLIIYALPSILATSAPFASLVGTLMCIGRFVSEREILAMNALGVSVRFILIPVLCVGVLISVVSFITNDILLPAGTIQFNKLYRKILTSTPALELESNSIKRNQNAIVVSGTISGSDISSIVVVDVDSDGNNRIIVSPGARIEKSTSPAVVMTLDLAFPKILVINRKKSGNFDSITAKSMSYNILSKSILSAYSNTISPHEMSSRDLYTELRKKDFGKDTRTKNMYLMEFQKKFSIPFGAFFFIILAFPLGLISKTNGQIVGFILGLIISVLYWAMLIGGQMLTLQLGVFGSLMMWLPNIVVFGVGAILILRSITR
jgi:lipopolysaccharide export system permease protein